jgi:hypothetical protein
MSLADEDKQLKPAQLYQQLASLLEAIAAPDPEIEAIAARVPKLESAFDSRR